ncbi:PREDICTED: triple QxxK/R motif-containing protein [Propithecus coquereli]|uniref:triple QxxK/R motif-containing protein n=1 Tax=Propithecus coquereli TaxID=379532 RepID=UPI00063EE679|nr:PREDICTED: triple QxxK/R motif-containing protein [Propithecus coquereli]
MGRKDAATVKLPVDQYRKQIVLAVSCGKKLPPNSPRWARAASDLGSARSGRSLSSDADPAPRSAAFKMDPAPVSAPHRLSEVGLVLAAILALLLAFYAFFYLRLSTDIDPDLDSDED